MRSSQEIRLKFSDMNLKSHSEFSAHLTDEEILRLIIAGTHIKNVKVFWKNTKLEGYDVHEEIYHPNFFVPTRQSKNIYLGDEEINKILILNLSYL